MNARSLNPIKYGKGVKRLRGKNLFRKPKGETTNLRA